MPKAKPALEFKGRVLSLTRVRVLDPDLKAIEAHLRNFARQMPQAVEGLPVILESEYPIELAGVLKLMRDLGMQPLAVMEGALAADARLCGLPVLPLDVVSEGRGSVRTAEPVEAPPPPPPPPAPAPAPPLAVRRSTRIVTEPVRSGQQIYAEGADLIVTQLVSPGAEVISDGCIHVYGTLRGRALAGARGDTAARIFCRKMEADLLAVAGVYAVADQMQGALRGQAVQASLVQGKLKIERLDS
ncbi:MAG: putative septum site-determining protein MinC [Hydrocarboniphaga sp.]|uniref:septum site-determining protein MinC n=1 Tax=Hydrocarboniphaga sp. TaxID=2033016 RepID=UPI002613DF9B|nr:septum site-determining protein MinC [Hydrocarboniphaga sp.]MDB5971910.1 putative septum site-determining protein MinC [Hydrocarboniphaga sp.]